MDAVNGSVLKAKSNYRHMHSEIQSIHQAQKKASALSIDKQHSGGGTGDNGAASFLEWRFSRDFTDVCTAAWEERTDQKCLDF